MLLEIFSVFCIVWLSQYTTAQTKENGTVTLSWTITSTSSSVDVRNPSGVTMFTVNEQTVTYTWSPYIQRFSFLGNTTTGDITFILKDIRLQDAGTYSTRSNGIINNGATLIVYAKPSTPLIEAITGNHIVNTNLKLNCTGSSTSRPLGLPVALSYNWYVNGGKKSNGGRYSISNNEFTLHGISRWDDGMKITCLTYELTDLPSETSSPITVTPEYSPQSIRISPSSTNYVLQEIYNTLGPITCVADCSPNCTYQWKHGSTNLTEEDVLTIPNITRDQTGIYTCKASNQHGTGSYSLTVRVEYGPGDITLSPNTSTYTFEEKSSFGTISCASQCYPGCSYQWKRDGVTVKSSSSLYISSIRRDEAGAYTCTATNKYSSKTSSSVLVFVEYGPGTVTFSPSTNQYTLLETTNTLGPITCSASCNPNCTYEWRQGSVNVSTETVLLIPNIQRGHAGTYRCTARNKYNTQGQLSNQISVTVEYAPGTVVVSPGNTSYSLLEHRDTLGWIECSSLCLPSCSFSWTRGGSLFSNSKYLHISSIKRSQAGNYVCTARNKHGSRNSAVIHVTVNVIPDPPRLIEVICFDDSKAAVFWTSNAIGGTSQYFTILRKEETSQSFDYLTQKHSYLGEDRVMSATVYSLQPSTTYNFSITATNSYGSSSSETSMLCTTGTASAEATTTSNSAGAAMLAIGIVFLVAAIIFVVIIELRRRDKLKICCLQNNSGRENTYESRSELTDIAETGSDGNRTGSVDYANSAAFQQQTGDYESLQTAAAANHIYSDLQQKQEQPYENLRVKAGKRKQKK